MTREDDSRRHTSDRTPSPTLGASESALASRDRDALALSVTAARDAPVLSIIVVTWNRRADILETIRSIHGQSFPDYEIIVVDNGSSDGTSEAIEDLYPEVNLIALRENRGVAGRNEGIRRARGSILLFLDSDASPGPETLATIVRRFESDRDLGAINSKIINPDTLEPNSGPGWVYSAKQRLKEDEEFDSYSFSEGGAAVRADVIREVGPVWERLFFGCEGQELSLRIWDAGYRIVYCPLSVVYHRHSPTARVDETQRDCMFTKNTLLIYMARYPLWLLALLMPPKVAASLLRATRRGYPAKMIRAIGQAIGQLPILYRERHTIRHRTAWRYLKMQRDHGALSWSLVSWLRHKT